MSKNLYDLREMLCEELDEYNRDAKNGLNERVLDTVHKLWEADMRGNYGRTENYNRGNSYANRGRHYVRGHYSRGDGRERMISDIENMMQDATGAERDAYKRALDILNNM